MQTDPIELWPLAEIPFHETSAKSGYNVDEVFLSLAHSILRKRAETDMTRIWTDKHLIHQRDVPEMEKAKVEWDQMKSDNVLDVIRKVEMRSRGRSGNRTLSVTQSTNASGDKPRRQTTKTSPNDGLCYCC